MQGVRTKSFPARALVPLLLGLGLALLLAACGGGQEERELRIGLLIPLSNTPERFIAHRALEQQIARVNAAGGLQTPAGKAKVRLLVEDTGGQIERMMNAVNRLIHVERVAAIIGPYYSREAVSAGAAAESAQVVMISPTASNPAVTRGRPFVFRACLVDTDQAQVMASCAVKDMGLGVGAALFDAGDAYSRDLAATFRDLYVSLGGRMALFEGYPPGTEDFTPAIARLKASGAKFLYLPNFSQALKAQMAQARAAGFSGVFLGGDSWDGDRSLHALPEVQGALFTADFFSGGLADKARVELETYAAVLGEPMDKKTVLTLDSMGLVLAAASRARSLSPADLREALAATKDHEGFTGRISFLPDGDPDRSVHVLQVDQGGVRQVKVVERGMQ